MKTILLILVLYCILYSVQACASGSCSSCSDNMACVGVASNACAWNFSTNACDEAPSSLTACSDYDYKPDACYKEPSCQSYRWDNN